MNIWKFKASGEGGSRVKSSRRWPKEGRLYIKIKKVTMLKATENLRRDSVPQFCFVFDRSKNS